jgi:hypothetical protein
MLPSQFVKPTKGYTHHDPLEIKKTSKIYLVVLVLDVDVDAFLHYTTTSEEIASPQIYRVAVALDAESWCRWKRAYYVRIWRLPRLWHGP